MRRPLILCLFLLVLAGCRAEGAHVVGMGGPSEEGGGVDAGRIGPSTDVCDNGVDDNGDGLIDEGCTCVEGARQACWAGSATRRGVGACRDGVQRCEPFGEFMAWGSCRGAVLPTTEIEANGIDEDCDGGDQGGSSCLANEFGESCSDGADDDCDGLSDCDDPDCASDTTCMSSCVPSEFGELCDDGVDNDCDGQADCLDPECDGAAACDSGGGTTPGCTSEFPFVVEIRCGDGRDNDCDGLVDCGDSDCMRPGSCGCDTQEAACTDGTDNDCDGSSDCSDLDCQRCTPGSTRWCDDPMYCHWGTQTCGSDGRWGTCTEAGTAPSGCTSTLYSATCCVDAGECCQNYPTDDESIGDCSGVVTCM